MNKVYRSVWNASTGTWVAAPETARRQSKGSARLACAVVLGSALLSTHQAMACTTVSGSVSCTGAADDFTLTTPSTATSYSITDEAVLHINDLGNISSDTHTITDGQIEITTRGAISGGTFNLSNTDAADATRANIFFTPSGSFGFANLSGTGPTSADGAILGGTFNLSGWGFINANTWNAVIGGTFNLSDDAHFHAGGVENAVFNLYDDSLLTARSINDSRITLNDSSVMDVNNTSVYHSTITLNDSSTLTFSDTSVALPGTRIEFAGANTEIDLAGTQLSIDRLTSQNVGDGRLYSSAQHGSGMIRPTVYIDGRNANPNTTYKFSALLDTPTGGHDIELNFSGHVNWSLQGHASNTARLIFGTDDASEYINVHSEGFQHTVYIGPNGRLTGLGSYNTLAVYGNPMDPDYSSGVISPGIGTISTDNFHMEYGGTYEVTVRDAAGSGNSSRIETDTMLLQDDARVHVVAQSGAWNTQRDYEIIRVNTGFELDPMTPQYVTAFDPANVTSNFAYLTPTVTTVLDDETDPDGPASIMLTLARNGSGTFASQAQTPNQRAVANAVETLPSGHAVYNYVETLPVGAPPAAFNSLSGEAHASFLAGLPNITSHAYRLPLANLRHSLNAGLNPAAVTAQVGGTQGSSGLPAFGHKPAWVELVGNWQNVDGDSNAGSLDQNSAGVFAGYDNDLGNGWYLGGALGYTQTDADVSSRDSEADIHSYSATLYGGKAFALDVQRQLNVLGGLSYTYHDIDSERKVRALEQKLTAGYDAHTTQVFGEVGYLIGKPDGRYVEPFAGLTVSHLEVGSFKEKGGSAALKGDSDDDTQVVSSLGVRGQLPYEFGNFGATLRGSLAWQHAFGDEHMDATMRFVDGSHDFNVRGVSLERDTAVLGLGTQLNVSANAAISLDYEGRYASGLREHSASLKAQWNF
ncbi:MAG: autotransporter domain-containing protein [Pseudomonas sp.]|jgi:outer membrane autotransporter protein